MDPGLGSPVGGEVGLSDWLLGGTHHKGLTTADYCVVAAYVIIVVFVGSRWDRLATYVIILLLFYA